MSKIQNENVKSESELIADGGTKDQLINDTKIYVTGNSINKTLDDAILDGDIGGGGAEIGYITGNDSNFEGGIGSHVTYVDAAGTIPVDGTGGTANITFSTSTANVQEGTQSARLSKDANDRQGEGVSLDVSIDAKDQAQLLYYTFAKDTSADYADDDIKIVGYDVTNSNIVRANIGEDLKAGKGYHVAGFQIPADCNDFRLILHISSTSALAYDVDIDDVQFARIPMSFTDTQMPAGSILTWTSSDDPTGYWLLCDGSAVSRTTYSELFDAVGTTYGTGDGSTTFNLPDLRGEFLRGADEGRGVDAGRGLGTSQGDSTAVNGLSVDTENLTGSFDTSNGTNGGTIFAPATSGVFSNTGTTNRDTYSPTVNTNDRSSGLSMNATHNHSLSGDSETRPRNVAVRYYISYSSGSAQQSQTFSNRDVYTKITGTSTQNITSTVAQNIQFNNVVTDKTSLADLANNAIKVNESGLYAIRLSVDISNGSGSYNIRPNKNLSSLPFEAYVSGDADSSGNLRLNTFALADLVSGDSIGGFVDSFDNADGTYDVSSAVLELVRIGTSQTLLERPTVAGRYTTDSGQSIPNTTLTAIVFNEELEATHPSLFDTTTGIFTAELNGYYHFTAGAHLTAISDGVDLFGEFVITNKQNIRGVRTTAGKLEVAGTIASGTVYLDKGDTVKFSVFQDSGSSKNLEVGKTVNYFTYHLIK
jgi:microcystin-dependent protein